MTARIQLWLSRCLSRAANLFDGAGWVRARKPQADETFDRWLRELEEQNRAETARKLKQKYRRS